MKLENLQISLTQRTPWQAIDLGLQVTRRHYKNLLTISFILVCVLTLLLLTLCQSAIVAAVLLFWFKPIIERPLLYYISRAIFDDAPTVKQALYSLKGPSNKLWFKTLFVHRFSSSRSFNDPVVLLEGLSGDARSKRLSGLHNTSTGSFWLSFIAIHIEYALQMALFILPVILLPAGILEFDFAKLFEISNSTIAMFTLITYAIAVSLVAPFYVCCGFILYLNRRTHLEAWDIELGFKKIKSRLSQVMILSIFTLVAFTSLNPTPSWAQDSLETTVSEEQNAEDLKAERIAIEEYFPINQSDESKMVKTKLNTLLNSDVFGEHYKDKDYSIDWDLDWNWDWDWDFEPKENKHDELPWLSLIKEFALYFKYFMILLLSLLLLMVLIKYQPWLYFSRFKKHKKPLPKTILGMDVSQNSLPDNFINLIQGHLNNKQFRAALSLMFRAHLVRAVHVQHIPFKQSNTEQECLQLLKAHCSVEEAKCFAQLVQHWQMLAYAHENADEPAINVLFRHWQTFINKEPIQ